MKDVFVHYLNLPDEVDGFASKNPDDTYSIILNARYSQDKQKETFLHELAHIQTNDFDNESATSSIEIQTHKKIKPYLIDGL